MSHATSVSPANYLSTNFFISILSSMLRSLDTNSIVKQQASLKSFFLLTLLIWGTGTLNKNWAKYNYCRRDFGMNSHLTRLCYQWTPLRTTTEVIQQAVSGGNRSPHSTFKVQTAGDAVNVIIAFFDGHVPGLRGRQRSEDCKRFYAPLIMEFWWSVSNIWSLIERGDSMWLNQTNLW